MARALNATLRFAGVADFGATEAVYREWFPTELSVDDSVYAELLARGGYVRIVELTFADATKQVAGFYTFWPLTAATYKRMTSGETPERNLTGADIARFDDPEAAVLYVPEIGISKGTHLGRLIVRDALDYACKLLTTQRHFRLVSAWGYSAVGKSIATRLGMKQNHLSAEEFFEISSEVATERCSGRSFSPEREIAL